MILTCLPQKASSHLVALSASPTHLCGGKDRLQVELVGLCSQSHTWQAIRSCFCALALSDTAQKALER